MAHDHQYLNKYQPEQTIEIKNEITYYFSFTF